MATAPLFDASGREAGQAELSDAVWGAPIREALVHQAVVRELANRRQGTADTKSRSEVRGGGKKPYRQKGTGRARQGSIRAPHWRHGGIVHGPTPRSYRLAMPQKMRRGAVLSALAAKAADGSVKVIERLEMAEISTKTLRKLLDAIGLNGSKTVVLMTARDEKVALSARNLPDVRIRVLPGLSTYEVMSAQQLLVTRDALAKLQEIYAPAAAEPRATSAAAPAAAAQEVNAP